MASGRSSHGEMPAPPVTAGAPDIQPAALEVPNTAGIPGAVASDTSGWPADRDDGRAAQAVGHTHVSGPVTHSVTPPVGGDHRPIWLDCGAYDQSVPSPSAPGTTSSTGGPRLAPAALTMMASTGRAAPATGRGNTGVGYNRNEMSGGASDG